MFSRSRKCAAAVALAGTLVLSACGGSDSANNSSDSSSGGSDTPIQWGVNAELSGPLSFYGASIAAGVQAYVDQANAAGGLDGHKIELTTVDNAGDQSRSAANATQLVTANKVTAIFGESLSTNCAAAQPIAERYKVPLACLSVAQGSPYVFSLGPNNGRAASAMLKAAKTVTGESRDINAAVFMLTTLTDQQLKKDIQDQAKGEGVNIVTSQDADVTATDVSSQIAQIVAAKPDVVLISATGPGFVTALKGARAAGLRRLSSGRTDLESQVCRADQRPGGLRPDLARAGRSQLGIRCGEGLHRREHSLHPGHGRRGQPEQR